MCDLCNTIEKWKAEKLSTLVYEFKNSILVVGEHQYFKGYSVLISKHHAREIHDLAPQIQTEMFSELISATTAIFKAFKPWKMNHASYGNQSPHVHWHIIPRYESDPDKLKQPWHNSNLFGNFLLTPQRCNEVKTQILQHL